MNAPLYPTCLSCSFTTLLPPPFLPKSLLLLPSLSLGPSPSPCLQQFFPPPLSPSPSRLFPSSIPPWRLRQAPTRVTLRVWVGAVHSPGVLNAAAAAAEVAESLLCSRNPVSRPRTVSSPPATSLPAPPLRELSQGGQQSRRAGAEQRRKTRQHLAAAWNLICFLSPFIRDIFIYGFGESRGPSRSQVLATSHLGHAASVPPPHPQLAPQTSLTSLLLGREVATARAQPARGGGEEGGAGGREPPEAALGRGRGGRAALKTQQPPSSARTHPAALFPDYLRTELFLFH